MNGFELMNEEEIRTVEGGLLAGALTGAILGGTVGLMGAVCYGAVKGNLSGGTIYRAYVTGALSGAAIGTYTPV